MLANKSYHHYFNRFLEHIDVQHHYQVIILLKQFNGKATQKQLCEHLLIEKSNMAAIIDALELKGYVSREINYRDRRGKLVVLTKSANEVIQGLEATFEHFKTNIIHQISRQEMECFLYVLKTINVNLFNSKNQAAVVPTQDEAPAIIYEDRQ